ncbi:MAG: Ig-like domain repeat protein [Solirubrobacteraceae bacterium]
MAAIVSCLLATVVSWSVLVGVASAATLTAPTISGTAQEGQTLQANPGTPGPAGDTFGTPTYQWLVCHPTCANGPTGASFPLTATEVGATIEVAETVNDTASTATAPNPVTATSAPTAAVVALAPVASTPLPSISGLAQLGQTLTAVHGGWTNTPTAYTDVWERCTAGTCVATGVTAPTYLVALADVGSTMEFVETASNSGGTSATSETSSPTAVVVAPPVNTVLPTISGTPQQGQVLTVTPGAWTNTPTSITEQWEDCALVCAPIPGQTGTSYTVGPNDVGQTIEVVETAFNTAAPLGVAAVSAPTGVASTTSNASVVAFSQNAPTTNQPITLVATISSNSGNADPHGSLSFFNGSSAVPGCANKGVSGGQTITIVCQASFPAGVAQISVAYVADSTTLVAGSSSNATQVSIGKGPTSVSLAVSPKVAPGGQATYVATLTVPVTNAGPTLPSGSIEFLDGGQPIGACASQALSSLTATCSVSYASRGTHSISALYIGDSNFVGSTSPSSGVQIVSGAPKAPAVHGKLGSTLGWSIFYHPHYSELTALEAFAVSKGTSILVQCYGKACPFAKWHLTKAAHTINLVSRFRYHHLRAGTRITVRMTRRHWVGKYYSFTMRAGRPPMIKTACLAPGKAKPGVGC